MVGKSIRELIDKVRDATKNADLTVGKVAEYADTGLGAISVGKDLADVVAGDYSAVQDLFDDGVEFIQTLLGDAFETPIIEAGLLPWTPTVSCAGIR